MNDALSINERKRFARHLALPGFSETHQLRLKHSRVLIAGCGGLGHPFVQYLAASGVGHIGLADHDLVEDSNLHRQTLFSEKEKGRSKADVLADRCAQLYPSTQFTALAVKLDTSNILEIVREYDFVADCTDNFATRYLLSDACYLSGKPEIYGAIYRNEGQVALFHGKEKSTYRDLFPVPPDKTQIPDCETGGLLGAVAGTIGSMMALEAIRWLSGYGARLDGKILHLDLEEFRLQTLQLTHRPQSKIKSLENNYETFCQSNMSQQNSLEEITSAELKRMMQDQEEFTLIDVREESEYEAFNLGGILIPMGRIPQEFQNIPRDQKVIIHCHAGVRSAAVVRWLVEEKGYTNVYNLQRGILDWE